ncbi:restriction endonuclease [uncultured Chryseobacterium sp.]|uniref:McrC family protein n=1 Tax=uncultured Chryseobacterium sp. TaxID=259322 RepID=UPI0025E83F09|nr:restriction endonuclease [uncultured Chryseobacterium sp.]
MLKTTDNNCGSLKLEDCDKENLSKIANVKISEIDLENNKNLLIFPDCLGFYGDRIHNNHVFSIDKSVLTTGNIMGFVGLNNSELTINSRFSSSEEDFFLHYMLQKVFSINVFDLKHSYNSENIFDFLLYLFPYFLKKALRQGLYKQYETKKYNNSNVRGKIDVNNHLKKNIPFNGRIAYSCRELSYDNRINQLIRHTVEHIQKYQTGHQILNNDQETKSYVNNIISATPTYNKQCRNSIIDQNHKFISHPFFNEYRELQNICLQILCYNGLKYGHEKDKVYGLLFDGAWLWEEYLSTLLNSLHFIHPENNLAKNPIYIFQGNKGKRYPDFWKDDFILDAKYKKIINLDIDRNDLHQIICYMYIKQAKTGGIISPTDVYDKLYHRSLGNMNGYGGSLKIWLLPISKEVKSYKNFSLEMCMAEKEFIASINECYLNDLSVTHTP